MFWSLVADAAYRNPIDHVQSSAGKRNHTFQIAGRGQESEMPISYRVYRAPLSRAGTVKRRALRGRYGRIASSAREPGARVISPGSALQSDVVPALVHGDQQSVEMCAMLHAQAVRFRPMVAMVPKSR
jgi:hypothetical protein